MGDSGFWVGKAATMSTTTQMTADELLRMPRGEQRHELVDGELITMSPAGSEHGAIIWEFAAVLANFIRQHKLGRGFSSETGFVLRTNPDTVRCADAAFVRRERIEQTGLPKGFYPGPPDLAVEVISPSDTIRKVDEKVDDWLAHGAVEVWTIHPGRQSVTIYRSPTDFTMLTRDDTLESPQLLPGFRLPVRDIFPA
jgi:Uma2 family endonuclease